MILRVQEIWSKKSAPGPSPDIARCGPGHLLGLLCRNTTRVPGSGRGWGYPALRSVPRPQGTAKSCRQLSQEGAQGTGPADRATAGVHRPQGPGREDSCLPRKPGCCSFGPSHRRSADPSPRMEITGNFIRDFPAPGRRQGTHAGRASVLPGSCPSPNSYRAHSPSAATRTRMVALTVPGTQASPWCPSSEPS